MAISAELRCGWNRRALTAVTEDEKKSTKGNGSADATLTMVFKLCKEAEKNWRRLKGFEKLQLVKEDKTFVDGILQIAA